MRILVINGSPRKKGNVATMLHHVVKDIEGASVRWIDVNDLNIRPCTGCMKCRETEVCILPHDDAHLIAEEIKQCDVLVMGTPVYWGNMNGQMKLLFDRIVPSMMGESKLGIPIPLHKGKKAVIVTACTTIWPFSFLFKQTTKSLRAMREILHYSGFKVIGKVVYSGTKGKKVIPERLLRKSERLGAKLSKLQ
ncbi:MAG: flavodoxin family protein [Bacteroidales bacterium]|nr:flavodoxin family protein [Bacteroidales bacterium]